MHQIMERTRGTSPSTSARVLTAAFLSLTALGLPVIARAEPTGAAVVQGQATVTYQGPNTTINQATDKAIINWQDFSVGPGEHTAFQVPNQFSATLNRVVGNNLSMIFGKLTSNGQMYLINPNGIVFANGSEVDVNSLFASTLDLKDQDFMKGVYAFSQKDGQFLGKILNQGTIRADEHGNVALIAPSIENQGLITATKGAVVLGAGTKATVDFDGDGKLLFALADDSRLFDANGNSLGVNHSGQIVNVGGTVFIQANTARSVLDQAINVSGLVKVSSVSTTTPAGVSKGKVLIKGGMGGVEIAALLDAAGVGNAKGGEIDIRGGNIKLASTAKLDVSGDQNADAGSIIVYADHHTEARGQLLAMGGKFGGNGGFIETSSHGTLDITDAYVNTNAPYGGVGNWLLDPPDYTIDSTVASTLAAGLANTNVMVETAVTGTGTGNINVNASISIPTSRTLTLKAYNNIVFGAGAQLTLVSGSTATLVADMADASDTSGLVAATTTVQGTIIGNGVNVSGSGTLELYYRPYASNGAGALNYTLGSAFFSSNISGGPTVTRWEIIASTADGNQFSTDSNSGGGFYNHNILLTRNITGWNTPINDFNGTFEGANHTIGNKNYTVSSNNFGVFKNVGLSSAANFYNLTLDNIGMSWSGVGYTNVGILVGSTNQNFSANTVTITNSSISATAAAGTSQVGLVSGLVTGTGNYTPMFNSSIQGSITFTSSGGSDIFSIGGVFGIIQSGSPLIQNVNNNVSINISAGSGTVLRVGGLFGILSLGGGTIKNVVNYGNIAVSGVGSNKIGGIVGTNSAGSITSASNFGNITNSSGGLSSVGGIVGEWGGSGTGTGLYNSGLIQAGSGSYAGGILGKTVNTVAMDGAMNIGNVTANQYVGGIVGSQGTGGTFQNLVNTGNIVGIFNMAGGIIGEMQLGNLHHAVNFGAVSGPAQVGGIVGRLFVNSTSSYLLANYGTITGMLPLGSSHNADINDIGGLIGVFQNQGNVNVTEFDTAANFGQVGIDMGSTFLGTGVHRVGGIFGSLASNSASNTIGGTIAALGSYGGFFFRVPNTASVQSIGDNRFGFLFGENSDIDGNIGANGGFSGIFSQILVAPMDNFAASLGGATDSIVIRVDGNASVGYTSSQTNYAGTGTKLSVGAGNTLFTSGGLTFTMGGNQGGSWNNINVGAAPSNFTNFQAQGGNTFPLPAGMFLSTPILNVKDLAGNVDTSLNAVQVIGTVAGKAIIVPTMAITGGIGDNVGTISSSSANLLYLFPGSTFSDNFSVISTTSATNMAVTIGSNLNTIDLRKGTLSLGISNGGNYGQALLHGVLTNVATRVNAVAAGTLVIDNQPFAPTLSTNLNFYHQSALTLDSLTLTSLTDGSYRNANTSFLQVRNLTVGANASSDFTISNSLLIQPGGVAHINGVTVISGATAGFAFNYPTTSYLPMFLRTASSSIIMDRGTSRGVSSNFANVTNVLGQSGGYLRYVNGAFAESLMTATLDLGTGSFPASLPFTGFPQLSLTFGGSFPTSTSLTTSGGSLKITASNGFTNTSNATLNTKGGLLGLGTGTVAFVSSDLSALTIPSNVKDIQLSTVSGALTMDSTVLSALPWYAGLQSLVFKTTSGVMTLSNGFNPTNGITVDVGAGGTGNLNGTFSMTGPLTVLTATGGAVNFNGPLTTTSLTATGTGALNFNNNVTLPGAMSLAAGQLSFGAFTYVAPSGATLSTTSGSLSLGGTFSLGSNALSATSTSGAITVGAAFSKAGAGLMTINTGGVVTVANTLSTGGILNITGATISHSGGSAAAWTSTGAMTLTGPFTNSGSNATFTSSGNLTFAQAVVSNNARVVAGGTVVNIPGISGTNADLTLNQSGSFVFGAGPYTMRSLTVNGGTFNYGSNALVLSGDLNGSAVSLFSTGGVTVAGAVNMTSMGVWNGALSAGGTLLYSGAGNFIGNVSTSGAVTLAAQNVTGNIAGGDTNLTISDTLTGDVNAGNALTLDIANVQGGSILSNGTITAVGGNFRNATFSSTQNTDINITGAFNATATSNGALVIAASTIGGTFNSKTAMTLKRASSITGNVVSGGVLFLGGTNGSVLFGTVSGFGSSLAATFAQLLGNAVGTYLINGYQVGGASLFQNIGVKTLFQINLADTVYSANKILAPQAFNIAKLQIQNIVTTLQEHQLQTLNQDPKFDFLPRTGLSCSSISDKKVGLMRCVGG